MKVIIAGSRNIISIKLLRRTIKDSGFTITEVVSGKARGVDTLGEEYAETNGILVQPFKADWTKYKKRAGILRNIEMGDYADALIALWDCKSRGTKHMIDYATKKGLKVYVGRVNVIELDDSVENIELDKYHDFLNYNKTKGYIKEYDVLIENQKINISYLLADGIYEDEVGKILR